MPERLEDEMPIKCRLVGITWRKYYLNLFYLFFDVFCSCRVFLKFDPLLVHLSAVNEVLRPFFSAFVCPPTCSFIRSFAHSVMKHSFLPSFIHSFIQACNDTVNKPLWHWPDFSYRPPLMSLVWQRSCGFAKDPCDEVGLLFFEWPCLEILWALGKGPS